MGRPGISGERCLSHGAIACSSCGLSVVEWFEDVALRYLRITKYTCFFMKEHFQNMKALKNRIKDKHEVLKYRYNFFHAPGLICFEEFVPFVNGERKRLPECQMRMIGRLKASHDKFTEVETALKTDDLMKEKDLHPIRETVLEIFDRNRNLTPSQIAERAGLTVGFVCYVLKRNGRKFKLLRYAKKGIKGAVWP